MLQAAKPLGKEGASQDLLPSLWGFRAEMTNTDCLTWPFLRREASPSDSLWPMVTLLGQSLTIRDKHLLRVGVHNFGIC